MIVIFALVFFLIFFKIYSLNKQQLVESISISFITFSTIIALSTEILSQFNLLTFNSVLFFWILLFVSLFFLNKINYLVVSKNIIYKIKSQFNENSTLIVFSFISTLILYCLIFIQGIIYPPNNWDSLTYHLPRIIEWINHGNLENYPTHIIRQLYQPTLCEYFILHINLLSKSDLFSNSVQYFFLIGTIFTVIGLTKLIFNKINNLIIFIISSTIPHALLESSSTQNDVVHSFFIVSSLFFGIKLLKELNVKNFIFLGLATGLSLLSKAIAYIYLPIILPILGILILNKIIQLKTYKKIYLSIISIMIVLIINFPHSYRNYKLSKDIMGTDKKEKADYLNEQFNPKYILSTVIKNIGLHFDSFYVGNLGNQVVEKTHLILKQNLNSPASNVFDMKYNCNHDWKNHEDTQPNFIHLILFSLSLFLIVYEFKSKKNINKSLILINSILLLSFIFFCIILTWEPWNTRLHLPLFFLMCPSIYFILSSTKFKQFYLIFIFLFIIYGFFVVIFNYSRPYITTRETSNVKINDNRFQKYFSNQPHLYKDYLRIQQKMNDAKKIGLIITNDTWEYPIYFNYLDKKININHIEINNYTKFIKSYNIKNELDYIISNTKNESQINLNKSRYLNITPKNKHIWIYKLLN